MLLWTLSMFGLETAIQGLLGYGKPLGFVSDLDTIRFPCTAGEYVQALRLLKRSFSILAHTANTYTQC